MSNQIDHGVCGIINFNKPAGMTSHDCVSLLRRITGIRRIGHTGTLDPMATGVLPLCIGSAARINEYLELDTKSYRCTMQLGMTTDTLDVWGKTLTDCRQELLSQAEDRGEGNHALSQLSARLEERLRSLQGELLQVPPQYSAIRVNGKRLYEYARQGQTVEIRPRAVFIRQIGLISFCPKTLQAVFSVECSKGTYVRSICHQMGEELGCGAAMCGLIRTRSGGFFLDSAVSREELEQGKESGAWRKFLMDPDVPLTSFGQALVEDPRALWFVRGGKLLPNEVQIRKRPLYQRSCPNENAEAVRQDAAGDPSTTGTVSQDGSACLLHGSAPEGADSFVRWMWSRLPRERFRDAYCLYRKSDRTFLGVGVFDRESGLYRADRIFWKGGTPHDENI